MKAQDLADALGVPIRQVRYMIGEEILPGRAPGGFTQEHVAIGRRYMSLHERGFQPSAIKLLMAGGHSIPLLERHPVVLSVDPSVDPSAIDVEAVLADVAAALRSYVNQEQE